MSESKHTPGKWTVGWGEGLTGPTTPAVGGVTVSDSIEYRRWSEEFDRGRKDGKPFCELPKSPDLQYTPISVGHETVAVVTRLGGESTREANARLIAAAPAMLQALEKVMVGFEQSDDNIYCEAGCTARETDKNFCSCGRREKFRHLVESINHAEAAIRLAKEGK